jgi:hypothetical protein
LFLLNTTDVKVPLGSLDVTVRELAKVAVSSEVVITWSATVRTLGRVAILTDRENATSSALCRGTKQCVQDKVVYWTGISAELGVSWP